MMDGLEMDLDLMTEVETSPCRSVKSKEFWRSSFSTSNSLGVAVELDAHEIRTQRLNIKIKDRILNPPRIKIIKIERCITAKFQSFSLSNRSVCESASSGSSKRIPAPNRRTF